MSTSYLGIESLLSIPIPAIFLSATCSRSRAGKVPSVDFIAVCIRNLRGSDDLVVRREPLLRSHIAIVPISLIVRVGMLTVNPGATAAQNKDNQAKCNKSHTVPPPPTFDG